MTEREPLWTPSSEQIESSKLTDFSRYATQKTGRRFESYQTLHDWSCEAGGEFWSVFWDYSGIVGEKGDEIVRNEDKMPGAIYFPQASLNYAENLLAHNIDGDAVVFRCEDQVEQRWSWAELKARVSQLQQAFKKAGLREGDRVAAMMPNMPDTLAAMLAVTASGGVWSSCSPDFGPKGVLDRFTQVKPRFFLACDGYWYNGKKIDIRDKLSEIVPKLGAELSIVFSLIGSTEEVVQGLDKAVTCEEFTKDVESGELEFLRVPFSTPLFIMFSSGTTGVPKCIVHSHGGSLMQLSKEHQLHAGINPGDRVFYFTTCGWMMWNWLVTALASGATLLLYDGSPFAPGPEVLFDYAEKERSTLFGTSAKFIDAVRNTSLRPIETHDLSAVRMIGSTGSPLAPENFEFVYSGIKRDVHLASMSGGTDLMGCFVIAVPWLPVYKGEIQAPALGMDVQVWDDEGKPMTADKGELVCVKPFPSMPVGFLNDEDGSRYRGAYFETFPNVWCHGDFAEWTETGGMVIHGRSDATLNPGGVRIGTAEIYNQVEQLEEVEEGLCIGQEWNHDVRVVLFVRLAEGQILDDALVTKIRQKIRTGASPRHVPAKIIEVSDIPRTKSGKITELAVREIVHGRAVKNREALANPDSLDLFVDLKELSEK